MKIRGIEINFDFLDADDLEKFENEAKKVAELSNEKVDNMSMSEVIRKECNIIDNFFDSVFGIGTAEQIFNGKKNLDEHIKAFEDIVKAKLDKQSELQNTFNRYQPNREQRRYNQFKGRK